MTLWVMDILAKRYARVKEGSGNMCVGRIERNIRELLRQAFDPA